MENQHRILRNKAYSARQKAKPFSVLSENEAVEGENELIVHEQYVNMLTNQTPKVQ